MRTNVIAGKDIDPEEWDEFIRNSPQGSPYSLHFVLSTLLDSWSAVVVENAGKWEAVFPLTTKKKYGISYCFQLPWTQYGGVILAPLELKNASYLDKVKKLSNAIIDILNERAIAIDINLSPNLDYALPFLWKGFRLETRFSYQIDLTNFEFETSYSSKTRNTLKKVANEHYAVRRMEDIDDLYALYRNSVGPELSHLGHKDYMDAEKIAKYLQQNDMAFALEAVHENKFVAGVMIFTYKDMAIYPVGAVAEEHRNSGIMTLLIHEALKEAKGKGLKLFDFEGSVNERIERFFRGFGGKPAPYLNAVKIPKWLDVLRRKQ